MKKPSKSDFDLKKVKINTRNGNIEIDYKVSVLVDNGLYNENYKMKSDITPATELTEAMQSLKPMLYKMFGLTEKKSGQFAVTGISISGEDNMRGVVIDGIFATEFKNGQKIAINTPFLLLDKDYTEVIGFADLDELIDRIEEEVYDYIFEHKTAFAGLFN